MAIFDKYIRVNGVTFEGRQDILEELNGNENIRLQAEPENPYDPNAIAVYVVYPPEAKMEDAKVGFVPKDQASEIHVMMTAVHFAAEIDEITGGFAKGSEKAYFGLIVRLEASYDANLY